MGQGRHPGFSDIEFGFADAEKESAENPELLLNAYLDESHLVDKAIRGSQFLFLGYKGSGKTAIAERANLLQVDDSQLFVTVEQLTDFSYLEFKMTAGGAGDHQTRYPTAWGYLLLIALLKSLERDEGGREGSPQEYTRVIAGLKTLNLLPVEKLGELVKRSTKTSVRFRLWSLFEGARETVREAPDLQMLQVVGALQLAAEHFSTSSRHVIFVDGLDAVISRRDLQFQSLAALMREVNRLNNHFKRRDQPFKFVVLCRTDMFECLPGADTNKLRQDSGVELDWYDDPRHPERTRLVKLANIRAQASLRCQLDVFDEFLPSKVAKKTIRGYLLDHTRHTPRDLLQLLKRVQERAGDTERLTPAQVKSGVRDYSMNYFIGEIRNELAGYLDDGHIDNAITLLTSFSNPYVTSPELRERAAHIGYAALDLEGMLTALFNCSAIGMIRALPERDTSLYTFKFRNRTACWVPGSVMCVHPGAWKGLNIEPST